MYACGGGWISLCHNYMLRISVLFLSNNDFLFLVTIVNKITRIMGKQVAEPWVGAGHIVSVAPPGNTHPGCGADELQVTSKEWKLSLEKLNFCASLIYLICWVICLLVPLKCPLQLLLNPSSLFLMMPWNCSQTLAAQGLPDFQFLCARVPDGLTIYH